MSDVGRTWLAGGVLALLPALSFGLQYASAARDGTVGPLLAHHTVTVVDWVFVPFNLLAVWVIDWRRGGTLFALMAISSVLNATVHAIWQYAPGDGGHMISSAMVVLPGGWVHLAYSTIQTGLLGAFVFARRERPRFARTATALAVAYFVAAAAAGYAINGGFIFTDVVTFATGLVLVLAYPWLARTLSAPDRPPSTSNREGG